MGKYVWTFNKEFLTRAQRITQRGYEATLLLNCTLALVCLPIEKLINDNCEIIDQVYSKLEEIEVPIVLKMNLSNKEWK